MKKKTSSRQASDLPDDLSHPARRALAAARIRQLKQLTRLSEAEVAALHGVGPNTIKQLRRALKARGWSFARKKAK